MFKTKVGDSHDSEDEKKAIVWDCIVMLAMREKGLNKWECLNLALNSWDWLLLDGMLPLCLPMSLPIVLQMSRDHLTYRFNTTFWSQISQRMHRGPFARMLGAGRTQEHNSLQAALLCCWIACTLTTLTLCLQAAPLLC